MPEGAPPDVAKEKEKLDPYAGGWFTGSELWGTLVFNLVSHKIGSPACNEGEKQIARVFTTRFLQVSAPPPRTHTPHTIDHGAYPAVHAQAYPMHAQSMVVG